MIILIFKIKSKKLVSTNILNLKHYYFLNMNLWWLFYISLFLAITITVLKVMRCIDSVMC